MEFLANLGEFTILLIIVVPIIIQIALIIAVFNISKQANIQSKRQENIIKVLKENSKNTKTLTEELEIINKNVYAICDNIYTNFENSDNGFNDKPPTK